MAAPARAEAASRRPRSPLQRAVASVVRRGDGRDPLAPEVVQRLLGILYVAGASIGTVSMAFPQPPHTNVPGLFAIYGVAYVVGAILLLGRGRLPRWSADAGLAFGTALITFAIHFTVGRAGAYSLFYVWVSITAFYFFAWVQAFAQVVLVWGAFVAVLINERPPGLEEQWVITAGTVLVAGLFVGVLRRGMEQLIEDLEEAARTDHARLYAAERAARVEADRATESLARLQQVTDVALTHLKLDDLLSELLSRVSQVLGSDVAVILLSEEPADELRAYAARGLPETVWRELHIPLGQGFAGRIAAEARPVTLTDIGESEMSTPALRETGLTSIIGVPLIAEGRVIGVLCVGCFSRREFTPDEARLLQLAGDRAAVAIDHARLYEREHRIAETLQRSLLPQSLPVVPGLRVAARYLPARAEARVGGDWYDAIALDGGRLAVTIGDVAGHGIQAAALMGRLRDSLRASALEGASAAQATERVDRLFSSQSDESDLIATSLFMVVEHGDGRVDFSNAGHLPPLVLPPDGGAGYLTDGRSLPLGVGANGHRPAGAAMLPPGSLVLLYTDGLVERRDAGLETGLSRLERVARGAPREPEPFCDEVLERMLGGEGPADDVAVVAVATR
ncbi:MAG: SpoIIE family protein phosphatase [Actinobacteria bacterium]|nr:SpoIIE family protein phosphatase [Actinomycetota bacterium]